MIDRGTGRHKRADEYQRERRSGVVKLRTWPSSPHQRLILKDWIPPSGFLFLPWYGGLMLFISGVEVVFEGGTPATGLPW
jgi:hypothetical protein